jgi:hypothetical protein
MNGKKDVKIAYFGDHLLQDIQATHELDTILVGSKWKCKWDAIAVV